MKKVFNMFYEIYRKQILFALFALYVFLGVSKYSTLLNFSYWRIVINISECIIAGILVIYLVTDLINHKFYVTWYLFFGVICALVPVFTAGTTSLCFFLAFAYVFKGIEFKEISSIFAIIMFCSIAIIACFAGFGLIENLIIMRGDITRRCLGFSSATSASQFFMLAVLAYNYSRQENIKIAELTFEFFAIACIYCETNTRLSFAFVTLIILWSLALKYLKRLNQKISKFFTKHNKCFSILFSLLPGLVVLFFGILVLLYDNDFSFIYKLDKFFSYRIVLTKNAFANLPIKLFGSRLNSYDAYGTFVGVDSGFYQYLFVYGAIPTVFIMFTMIYIYYKGFRTQNYKLCFCLSLLCFDFMLGSSFIHAWQNVFILIIATLGTDMLFNEKYKVLLVKHKNMNNSLEEDKIIQKEEK